jgi:hypothetical protein
MPCIVCAVIFLFFEVGAAFSQVAGGGGVGSGQAASVCASNSGAFSYNYPIKLPSGQSIISFSYESIGGQGYAEGWGFRVPKVQFNNGIYTTLNPGGCTKELMTLAQAPTRYIDPFGSRYQGIDGKFSAVSPDGFLTQFIQLSAGNFVLHKTSTLTKWFNEYEWANGQLVGVKVSGHPANQTRVMFYVAISRNAQNEVTKIEVKSGDQASILRTYGFVWRTVNGVRALAAIIDRGANGAGSDTTTFDYRLLNGVNLLTQVTDGVMGGKIRAVYAPQTLSNNASRLVLSTLTTSAPPTPDLAVRFAYTGGTILPNGLFSGFASVKAHNGLSAITTRYDVSSYDKAGLVTGTESGEVQSSFILSTTSNLYEFGGPGGRVASLKETGQTVFAPSGERREYKTEYVNDFVSGRVTSIINHGEFDDTPQSRIDDSRVSFTYEPCSGVLNLLCTRLRTTESYLHDGSFFGRTTYSYDANNNVTSSVAVAADDTSESKNFTHDDYGNVANSSDSYGNSARYVYDENGYNRKQSIDLTYPENNTITSVYDSATKLVTAVVGRYGDRTEFSYDNRYVSNGSQSVSSTGAVITASVTNMSFGGATSTSTSNIISSSGTFNEGSASYLDASGRGLQFFEKMLNSAGYLASANVFDRFGNITRATYPFLTSSNQFDPQLANQFGYTNTYDAFNRLIASTQDVVGNGLTNKLVQYGIAAGPDGEIDPNSVSTIDGPSIHHESSKYSTSMSVSGAGASTVARVTTTHGNTTETKDSKGNLISVTTSNYLGRTTSFKDSTTAQVDYEYSQNGNIFKVIERQGTSYEEKHYVAGKLVRALFGVPSDPERVETVYTYNGKNQLEHVANFNGHFKQFSYNSDGLLASIQEGFPAQSAVIRPSCHFEYNNKQQLSFLRVHNLAQSGVVELQYFYDGKGEIAAIKSPNLPAHNYSDPNGSKLPGTIASWARDPLGLWTTITTPRARTQERCELYPGSLELKSCERTKYTDNQVLSLLTITYDPSDPNKTVKHSKNNQVGESTETVSLTNGLGDPLIIIEQGQRGQVKKTFEYDELGKVSKETREDLGTNQTQEIVYHWDPLFPYRLAKTVVNGVDNNNTYDSNGFRTSETDPEGHMNWRRLDSQGAVREYKSYENQQSVQNAFAYQHVYLEPSAGNPETPARTTVRSTQETVSRAKYCDGVVEIVETTESAGGGEQDKTGFVHVFGPDPAYGSRSRLATLTYQLAGTNRTVSTPDTITEFPPHNHVYENSPDGKGLPPPAAPAQPTALDGFPNFQQPQKEGYPDIAEPQKEENEDKKDKANDKTSGICYLPSPSASARMGSGNMLTGDSGAAQQNGTSCGIDLNPCKESINLFCEMPEPEDENGEDPTKPEDEKEKKCAWNEILINGECLLKNKWKRELCQQYEGHSQDMVACMNGIERLLKLMDDAKRAKNTFSNLLDNLKNKGIDPRVRVGAESAFNKASEAYDKLEERLNNVTEFTSEVIEMMTNADKLLGEMGQAKNSLARLSKLSKLNLEKALDPLNAGTYYEPGKARILAKSANELTLMTILLSSPTKLKLEYIAGKMDGFSGKLGKGNAGFGGKYDDLTQEKELIAKLEGYGLKGLKAENLQKLGAKGLGTSEVHFYRYKDDHFEFDFGHKFKDPDPKKKP